MVAAVDQHDQAEDVAIAHVAWLRSRGVTLNEVSLAFGFPSSFFGTWDEVIDYIAREWLRINDHKQGYDIRNLDPRHIEVPTHIEKPWTCSYQPGTHRDGRQGTATRLGSGMVWR